jgi:hypothetical protein
MMFFEMARWETCADVSALLKAFSPGSHQSFGYCWRTRQSRKLSLACGFFEGTRPWRCLAERLALEGGNRFANSIRRFVGHCTYMPKSNKPVTRGNKLI